MNRSRGQLFNGHVAKDDRQMPRRVGLQQTAVVVVKDLVVALWPQLQNIEKQPKELRTPSGTGSGKLKSFRSCIWTRNKNFWICKTEPAM